MSKLFSKILILMILLAPLTTYALSVTPNDPHFDTQYYISQTSVDQAWGYTTGSEDIVIAIIDAGIDINHPDLKDNIWKNKKEIPNNKKDDDKNGYIDDTNGWNFVENNNNPQPNFDDYSTEGASHGTVVAGIIAASGHNNEGLAGITWNSKIMPIRALNSRGEGNISNATKAIRYAVDNGADIINLSFVGQTHTGEFFEAIKYAYKKNVVLVAAVGNDAVGSSSIFAGGNLDVQPVYPACFKTTFDDFVIGVGAIDKTNIKTDFSNYGKRCLDVNAPGVEIISTQTQKPSLGSPFTAAYSGFWNGTSFAAPQVAGLAALIKSINPDYNNKQIASIILDTADNIDIYNQRYKGKMGKGIINARRALKAAAPAIFTPRDPLEIVNLLRNNKALWVSNKIETKAKTNNFLSLNITFKNKGPITWEPNYLTIKITDRSDKPIGFSPSKIKYQGSNKILPSQTVSFINIVRTPNLSGNYNAKFQLQYKGQNVKGGAVYKTIAILSSKSAKIIKNSIPLAVLKNWGSLSVNLSVTNNTKKTWGKKNILVQLKSNNQKLYISGKLIFNEPQISPGETATFNFILHFDTAKKGLNYYKIQLLNNDQILDLEDGNKVIRVD